MTVLQVTANGEPYEVAAGTSVEAFIVERGLDPRFVLVEWNGEPLERWSYETVTLSDGDRLELVRAVAGGSASAPSAGPSGGETVLAGRAETASTGSLGDWRRRRLAASRLYVVTGARAARGDLAEVLEAILDAGTDLVQLREKEAEAGDLLRWAEVFRAAAERHQAMFFVNDRPDVAIAAGADGVHVGQNDLPPAFVRGLVGEDVLIGLSSHDAAQLAGAAPEADYLCAGPVHETPTKPGRPATGLDLVRLAAERERSGAELRPWFAIGGIDRRTLPDVVDAGASRIVVVRAVAEADDPGAAVEALRAGLARR
jgi:thiamine-phosphate pyrophosphorylase